MQNIIKNLKCSKALGIELIVLVVGVISFFYWGNKKQVWFCDEIYTYESANGFEQEWPASYVDEWMTGTEVEAFFAADWDRLALNDITVRLYSDHVPLYFWIFRIVSLFFFKGSGSIWIGLSINLIIYLIILTLGYKVFLYLTDSPILSGVIILLAYITNRLMLEQITTIRMYAMLLLMQMLLLLAGMWILHDIRGSKMRPGVFVFLFIVSVTGFLTHYDFWIFYAVTAVIFCIWLLILAVRQRKYFWLTKEFRYIIAWLGNFGCSLLTAILLFPYCRWNLNRDKGQIAIRSIFVFSKEKIENIRWGYARLASSIFGDVFPAGALLILFGCIAGGAYVLYRKKKMEKLTGLIIIILVAQVYQLVVCFTLPAAREERYLWGSFAVMMLCMAWGGILILQEIFYKIRNHSIGRIVWYAASLILVIGIMADEFFIINGGNGVAYLFYPGKDVSLLQEHSEMPWIVYGYDQPVGVYSCYDWIIPEHICFLSEYNTAEDAAAFEVLGDEAKFILYVYEDLLPRAIHFFNETSNKNFTYQYLTKSTNLTVYLIETDSY